MKTVVLMGISCLMLAGVYGVMIKKSAVSKALSFNQANSAVSTIGAENLEKTTSATESKENKASASKTLDDSHWIDDPLFEKAAGSELVIDTESPEICIPQTEAANQVSPKKDEQKPVTEPKPEIKQLILELNPDTVAPKKIATEVV
jgi:hypothetical protein